MFLHPVKMIRLKCNSSSSKNVENILNRSVVTDGFEKLGKVVINNRNSRSKEQLKTKGDQWYHLPARKVTAKVRRDLELFQMRSVTDPKRFYKKNDFQELPKYFQIGHLQETPADFHCGRVPKRERKQTIMDKMLSDADFRRYTERRYREILLSDPKRRKKAQREVCKLNKMKCK